MSSINGAANDSDAGLMLTCMRSLYCSKCIDRPLMHAECTFILFDRSLPSGLQSMSNTLRTFMYSGTG